MAKPKKNKNGTWTVRVYDYTDENGKLHYKRFTKDTKAECELAAAQYKNSDLRTRKRDAKNKDFTIGEAVDAYIDLCRTLSPATVDGYEKIRRTGFPDLWNVRVIEFDEAAAQAAINEESFREGRRGQISAKTIANEWGLVSSALRKICKLSFDVQLPKRKRNIKDYPDPALVIEAVRGTSVELPCMLALWLSFSMSEIRGLQFGDLSASGDVITINRVMVDIGTTPTIKETGKAEARIRKHRLPEYLQQLIKDADHSQPWIVPLNHSEIYGRFKRLMDKAGLDITFHDLRHLNASVMLALNVPEKYAMERGGWKTPNVMKNVYQHTFSAQRVQIDNQIDEYFNTLIEGKKDENMTCNHDFSGQIH